MKNRAEAEAWVDSLTPDEARGQLIGLALADSKHKQKLYRQERSLLGLVDKNGKLRYELERLEGAMVECYKKPEHSKAIIFRVIPKRMHKETL